ncbi:hypothetical protein LCGC14_1364200 [marine sediment metagenome]|uniref:Uncharacterized protein n=1 Tax=marine sediment metagenome TaxID=412755 RepID=A0A0F9K7B3_9ZZZZ
MGTVDEMKMHDGCVHQGLRYSAYLRAVAPNAYVDLRRNNWTREEDAHFMSVKQRTTHMKLFGIPLGGRLRSLTEIVELAVAKIEEYDAVLETFSVEEEEE